VARLSKIVGRNDGRFTLLVSDHYQGMGLGKELLKRLIQVGRDEGLEHITAEMAADNYLTEAICRKLGFSVTPMADGQRLYAELPLI
jgi:acetyltransferase